jgi:hypothetical protein
MAIGTLVEQIRAGQGYAELRLSIFSEATGVFEMIARDPDQRSLYETRLKFERDVRAREEQAREEGRQEGEVIGTIKLLRQLLGDEPLPEAEFERRSVDELAELAQDLQRRLRERS